MVDCNKKALATRVSNETFEYVKSLTEGDNPAFESVSEYLYTLVLSDIALRKNGKTSFKDELKKSLCDVEIANIIRFISKT